MSPFIHGPVDDALIKAEPLVNQMFFQVIDLTRLVRRLCPKLFLVGSAI